jgi:hypothetical protein
MANYQYPADPFRKVDALLGDLIDSFQHADDCHVVAEIRETVANTMQLAAQRESRVQDSIKGVLWPSHVPGFGIKSAPLTLDALG